MAREMGFYFVQKDKIAGIETKNRWLIGFYDNEDEDWMLPGIAIAFKDSDFYEINEQRILPPQN